MRNAHGPDGEGQVHRPGGNPQQYAAVGSKEVHMDERTIHAAGQSAEDWKSPRRDVLRAGVAGLGVLAATSLATVARDTAPAGAGDGTTLTVDCACLGDTMRLILPPGAAPPHNMAGGLFLVQGHLYPDGTIPREDGWDPGNASATGVWICRGWFINSEDRPQPASVSVQEFVLGRITTEQLFPPDMLVSSGMEQAPPVSPFDPAQPSIRSIVGGVGRYAGAGGIHIMHFLGHNTTKLGPGGAMGPAPNFRFEFQLR